MSYRSLSHNLHQTYWDLYDVCLYSVFYWHILQIEVFQSKTTAFKNMRGHVDLVFYGLKPDLCWLLQLIPSVWHPYGLKRVILFFSATMSEHPFSFPQVRDAVAVMQLLMWLEKKVPEGTENELTAADFVDQSRRYRTVAVNPRHWYHSHTVKQMVLPVLFIFSRLLVPKVYAPFIYFNCALLIYFNCTFIFL